MFNRKPIYIILLVIFSLLLCFDITSYVITANNSAESASDTSVNVYGRGQIDANMPDMSSGEFDSSQMPDMSSGEFDTSQMPDMGSGEFDMSQMPGGRGAATDTSTSEGGIFDAVVNFFASWWILIGILCLLVDAVCILMLVRISKGKVMSDEMIEEMDYRKALKEEKISSYEKRRRKKRKMLWAVSIILAAFLLVIGSIFAVKKIYDAQLAEADAVTIVSAEASDADIEKVIYGTGTLEENEAESITVPDGVEISEYYVENGDTVQAGDAIAMVDHTSVMKTVAEVQEAMDTLDEDIDAAADDTIESLITAAVDGRVKVVYAEEGVAVSDTMYEYGALMLISLDGLMAVDIETDAEAVVGEDVTVQLADGTEEEGRVAGASNGIVTVTLTDDGTIFGEEVTIYDENGNVLGSSALYIHSELKVTGYSGTVASIRRQENAAVKAGYQLLRLTDTDYTAEHELLIQQRAEYEEVMMTLFKLYQDGNIYAEFSGTVSGIDEDNVVAASLPDDEETSGPDVIETSASGTGLMTQTIATLEYNYSAETEQTDYLLVYSDFGVQEVIFLGNNPKGTDDATVSTYSNFAAKVTKVTYGAIMLNGYTTPNSITDYTSPDINEALMVNEKQISPEDNAPVYMYVNGAWTQLTLNDISAGDTIIVTYNGPSDSDIVWIVVVNKSQTSDTGTSRPSGGSSGGSSSVQTTTEEEKTAEEIYPISENEIGAITPSEKMNVTITIDEMDILLMETGKEAVITLDAIEGAVYSGTVTDIDMTGTNSGGSTKYTAIVTLDKTDQMLAGMNAYVSITISSAQCNVTVPVAAIVESGTDTYVYTSYNEDEETLGGLTAVSTGLSDGTSVEILSGLNEGDTVWYEYNEEVNISSSIVDSSSSRGFNFMRILGGR